jgi:hypothetical protein
MGFTHECIKQHTITQSHKEDIITVQKKSERINKATQGIITFLHGTGPTKSPLPYS